MAKKSKGSGYRPIKNSSLIGKGTKIPVIKDDAGNREWAKGVVQEKKMQSAQPQVKMDKVAPAKAPVKPVQNLPLKSTTSLTPPTKAKQQVQQSQILPEKRASNLLKEAQAAKAAAAKKPPVKSPPARGK